MTRSDQIQFGHDQNRVVECWGSSWRSKKGTTVENRAQVASGGLVESRGGCAGSVGEACGVCRNRSEMFWWCSWCQRELLEKQFSARAFGGVVVIGEGF